jgi:hypothetical protein
MRRREFIAALGGAVTWPLAARGQQGERVRLVGFLEGISADAPGTKVRHTEFLEGLRQLGWMPGRNVRIEVRYGGGDEAQTRKYAAELIALAPDVILVGGTTASEVVLKNHPLHSHCICRRPRPRRLRLRQESVATGR